MTLSSSEPGSTRMASLAGRLPVGCGRARLFADQEAVLRPVSGGIALVSDRRRGCVRRIDRHHLDVAEAELQARPVVGGDTGRQASATGPGTSRDGPITGAGGPALGAEYPHRSGGADLATAAAFR